MINSTAVLSYHLRLLSSLIRGTVGGPTFSFVRGHAAGSFWMGLPPGGDPFVHHGVTSSEDRHELELFPHSIFPPPSFLFLHLAVRPQALPPTADMLMRGLQHTDEVMLDGTAIQPLTFVK